MRTPIGTSKHINTLSIDVMTISLCKQRYSEGITETPR